MGIPSYFVHIVKSYNKIIKQFKSDQIIINNLYIDSNSIIYDALKYFEYKNNNEIFEKKIIDWVCEKIVFYINLIKPINKVFLSFDGVAPVAKLNQQRNRRYKTWYIENYLQNKGEVISKKWDTTSITPGTKFMTKLHKIIHSYFNTKYKNENLEIIISSSDNHGEGEHKIYKYIRDNKIYHEKTNTIIYGLDADLIMLTLNHLNISPNLYLFRETPYFINSINKELISEENYVLDIFEMNEKITDQLINLKSNNTKNKEIYKSSITKDYIFMCFLLGNDFLPHFPALNIRTNGIEILLKTYSYLFKNNNERLIKDNKIIWKNLRKFINELAINEEYYCIEEMKLREKIEKRSLENISRFKTEEERLTAIPMFDRTIEKYINIGEEGWEERYYKELFFIDINDNRKQQICINYLEGLEWNFKYYNDDCPDWKWKYNYNYPPLLKDLVNYIPYFDTDFFEKSSKLSNIPVTPLVQLAYVLPRNSLNLLPEKLFENLLIHHNNWYKLDNEIFWVYCKYFWESHIILPNIDINILEKFINSF